MSERCEMSRELLWTPSEERIKNSNATKFMKFVEERCKFSGSTFHDLWEWSVSNPNDFWNAIWDFCGVIGEKGSGRISNEAKNFWEHRYFPDAKLNFTENLLRRRDDHAAIVFWGEEKVRRIVTWKELYDTVSRVATALKKAGVKKGDIVGGYVANMP